MAEPSRAPKNDPTPSTDASADAQPSPKQLQAIAHQRGRICKVRTCTVCSPLRDERRRKKAQRKADAQARAHAKGQPCGRSKCAEPACVAARHADATTSAPATQRTDDPTTDVGALLRRQAERHRAELPCGLETCARRTCADAFAQERARRHRARRPCKATDCANPICVSSRSTT